MGDDLADAPRVVGETAIPSAVDNIVVDPDLVDACRGSFAVESISVGNQ